ncbi:MAG TPA: LPS export ABC transporter periplasmic protein LptC [Candidatus Eremiobacteraceae bacterium]|nr:LPS export ABC transporter periplasmic protein LptC [Candidatus Eremiobacteraceae bacterium]
MHLRRLAILICLLAACRLAAVPAASATPTPQPKSAPKTGAAPVSVPTAPPSSTATCDKQMTFGEVTLCSNEFNFNFKTGDVQFPLPLHGRTSDGTYQADRGYGNLHSQIMNLIGHVIVHRAATHDKQGKPVEAMTLTADQTHIESKAKFYRASGNVKIVQGNMTMTAPLIVDDETHRSIRASGGVKIVRGDQTMTAPQITLDENTHVADLSGGVHAEQPPSRTFDAAEVFYNTQTQDFKAVGSVRMQFPANQPGPAGSPRPSPTPRGGVKPRASAAPSAGATPSANSASSSNSPPSPAPPASAAPSPTASRKP